MSGSCGFYNEFSPENAGTSRYCAALKSSPPSDASALDRLKKPADLTQSSLPGLGIESNDTKDNANCEAALDAYLEKLANDNFGSAWEKTRAEGALNYAYRVKYDDVPIPGLDEPHEDCGRVFSVGICPDCDYKHPIKNHCDRPGCAVCFEHWATKETKRVCERVEGFKTAYKSLKGRRVGNPMHIVTEKRGTEIIELVRTPKGIRKYLRMCADVDKKAGILSSAQVFHLYKIRKEIRETLVPLLKSDGEGLWDLVRNDALGLGKFERYVYVAPHTHSVGFGFTPNGKDVYEKSGWFIKNKGRLSNDEDIFRVVRYALSHCAVIRGMQTVRYYGGLSNGKLGKVLVSNKWTHVKCPLCGAELDKYYVLTGLSESYMEKEKVYVYKLKSRPRKRKKES